MLKLYQFDYVNGQNASPFCHKVELYLQLVRLPYEAVPTLSHKAPRGKLPYLVDGDKTIPDSGEIIEYLKTTYGDSLDQNLTPAEHAQGHLLRKLCEESVYFVLVYSRWLDPEFWPLTKEAFFKELPPVIKSIVPTLAQNNIKKSLQGQGYGRLPREQIYHLGAQDLEAVAVTLTHSKFAAADRPTSFDATLFAFLSAIINNPMNSPLKRAAIKHQSIADYMHRMKNTFEELKRITAS